MSSIPMPTISAAFAIEDIHKIREWNYEKRKTMTAQEVCDDTRKGAERFLRFLNAPVKDDVLAEVNKRLQTASK